MTRLPAKPSAGGTPQIRTPPGGEVARRGGFDPRQRDFLLLTIFVLAQQGFVDRAGILAEALHLAGDDSEEVLLARAVLRFFAEDWAAALACLEELDRSAPIERFGAYKLTQRQLKARCLYQLDDVASAREAVQIYLRHG